MAQWKFYVLRGHATSQQDGAGFWKLGTLPAAAVLTDNYGAHRMRMKGRMSYGSSRDPARLGTTAHIYDPPCGTHQRRAKHRWKVSRHTPVLGDQTELDPIEWHVAFCGADVSSKEIDQLIAAFADDAGLLVRDRGRARPASRGKGYAAAIEIVDGSTDLLSFLNRILAGHVGCRTLSADQRADLATLVAQLAHNEASLRP